MRPASGNAREMLGKSKMAVKSLLHHSGLLLVIVVNRIVHSVFASALFSGRYRFHHVVAQEH